MQHINWPCEKHRFSRFNPHAWSVCWPCALLMVIKKARRMGNCLKIFFNYCIDNVIVECNCWQRNANIHRTHRTHRYILILLYVTRTGKNSNGRKEKKLCCWKFAKFLPFVIRLCITITKYKYHENRFSGCGVHKSRTDKHSFLYIRFYRSKVKCSVHAPAFVWVVI